jgi:hypothetical protein
MDSTEGLRDWRRRHDRGHLKDFGVISEALPLRGKRIQNAAVGEHDHHV